MTIVIRPATPADADVIYRFIVGLAEYEREPHAVEVTPEVLRAQLSSKPAPFECLIAEFDGAAAGFALFFSTYSTWMGKGGIWLEDIFVPESLRRRGIGGALLRAVAKLAVERHCGRLEWAVLDWNQPAIDFYRSLGARAMDEWTEYRLTGSALNELAGERP